MNDTTVKIPEPDAKHSLFVLQIMYFNVDLGNKERQVNKKIDIIV